VAGRIGAAGEKHVINWSHVPQTMLWDWNLVTNEVEWNEGVHTLFGYWEQMWAPTLLGGMNVYTQRMGRVVCGIHNVIDSGGQIWSDEHRFL